MKKAIERFLLTRKRAPGPQRKNAYKKGVDVDDARRRREETTIQIRKNKKEERLNKRRTVHVLRGANYLACFVFVFFKRRIPFCDDWRAHAQATVNTGGPGGDLRGVVAQTQISTRNAREGDLFASCVRACDEKREKKRGNTNKQKKRSV